VAAGKVAARPAPQDTHVLRPPGHRQPARQPVPRAPPDWGASLTAPHCMSLPPLPLCPLPDITPPTFSITGGNVTVSNVAKNAVKASATSPSMANSDAVTAKPLITCTGFFNATAPTPTSITLAAGATTFSATYTMAASPQVTVITCSSKDAAGNESPARAFQVTLTCSSKSWNNVTMVCN
jgi:hypothetical protein